MARDYPIAGDSSDPVLGSSIWPIRSVLYCVDVDDDADGDGDGDDDVVDETSSKLADPLSLRSRCECK